MNKCKCGKEGVVGLNGTWLCLECFDKAMADIGRTVKMAKQALKKEQS